MAMGSSGVAGRGLVQCQHQGQRNDGGQGLGVEDLGHGRGGAEDASFLAGGEEHVARRRHQVGELLRRGR